MEDGMSSHIIIIHETDASTSRNNTTEETVYLLKKLQISNESNCRLQKHQYSVLILSKIILLFTERTLARILTMRGTHYLTAEFASLCTGTERFII